MDLKTNGKTLTQKEMDKIDKAFEKSISKVDKKFEEIIKK